MENNNENKTHTEEVIDNPLISNLINKISGKIMRQYSFILMVPVIVLLLIFIINILQLYIIMNIAITTRISK